MPSKQSRIKSNTIFVSMLMPSQFVVWRLMFYSLRCEAVVCQQSFQIKQLISERYEHDEPNYHMSHTNTATSRMLKDWILLFWILWDLPSSEGWVLLEKTSHGSKVTQTRKTRILTDSIMSKLKIYKNLKIFHELWDFWV